MRAVSGRATTSSRARSACGFAIRLIARACAHCTMRAIILRLARRADPMLYQQFLSVRPRESGDPGATSAFTRVFNALCTRTSQSLGPRFRGDERRMLLGMRNGSVKRYAKTEAG